ncbi:MAG: RNA polymerase sigma factor [Rhodospirillaceae bacterium]
MVSQVDEQTDPPAIVTLGHVLYAKAKAPPLEADWVLLVRKMSEGDQGALQALFSRAQHLVFTYVLRLTANRGLAEELTVDVFHDIWRHAARYEEGKGTVLAWIMNQARSRAIDRLRFEARKKRNGGGEVLTSADAEPDPSHVAQQLEQSMALRAAVDALAAEERDAIESTFFHGLTHAEAAVRLNQPLGTVKTRIRAGLHKLRRMLTAKEELP